MYLVSFLLALLPLAFAAQGQPPTTGNNIFPTTNVRGAEYPRITPDLYFVVIDSVAVSDPASASFYGSGKQVGEIEISEKEVDFYFPKEVPHGEVREQWYHSNTPLA